MSVMPSSVSGSSANRRPRVKSGAKRTRPEEVPSPWRGRRKSLNPGLVEVEAVGRRAQVVDARRLHRLHLGAGEEGVGLILVHQAVQGGVELVARSIVVGGADLVEERVGGGA